MSPSDGMTAGRRATRVAALVDALFGVDGGPLLHRGRGDVREMVPPADIGGDLERRAPVGIPSPPRRMVQPSPPGPSGDGTPTPQPGVMSRAFREDGFSPHTWDLLPKW